MEAQNTAKKMFFDELGNFLINERLHGLELSELKSQIHRLKGGAGMLQLLDFREKIIAIEDALKAGNSYHEELEALQQLYEKFS